MKDENIETIRRWWAELGDAFEELRIEMDAAWGSIVTMRDGRILSAVGYATPGEARRAAGLDPAA